MRAGELSMSNGSGSTSIQRDYLSEWKQRDSLKLANKSLELTYTSKPPIFDHIVTVLATCGDKTLFTGLFNIHPPHDLMSVDLHGSGTALDAAEIIRFLSGKIGAPVRMDMSANENVFTEIELQYLGTNLEVIKHNQKSHADEQTVIDGAI